MELSHFTAQSTQTAKSMHKKILHIGCTSNLPLAVLIRFFSKWMPWNKLHRNRAIPTHSAQAFYSSELDSVLVLDSSWRGYRITKWQQWRKRYKIIHAHFCTQHAMDASIKWAGKRLGTRYEYRSLFVYVWKIIKYKLGFGFSKHPYTSSAAMHCSEATTRFIKTSGYWPGIHADSVSPLEFMHRLDADKNFIDVTNKVQSGEWWNEACNK